MQDKSDIINYREHAKIFTSNYHYGEIYLSFSKPLELFIKALEDSREFNHQRTIKAQLS